jgi:microcompartment protein CcmK/EutM
MDAGSNEKGRVFRPCGGFAVTALRVAISVGGAAVLAAPAVAQQGAAEFQGPETAALVRSMSAAPCETGAAEIAIRGLLSTAPASTEVQNEALRQVAADENVCAGTREAALVISLGLPDTAADPDQAAVTASVAAIVSEAYAEADRRAAQLSFEVGPPPRNITRGRASGF